MSKNYTFEGICNILEYCVSSIFYICCWIASIFIGIIIVNWKIITTPIYVLRRLGGDPNATFEKWMISVGNLPFKMLPNKPIYLVDEKVTEFHYGEFLFSTTLCLLFLSLIIFKANDCDQKLQQQRIEQQRIEQLKEEQFKKEHPFTYKAIEYSKDVLEYLY